MKNIFLAVAFIFSVPFVAQTSPGRTNDQAKQLADSLYQQLKAGAGFEKIVATFSEDPANNKKGGLYSNVEIGAMAPEFENEVLGLNINEISKPFRTSFGYHIEQLLARNGRTFSVRHILIKHDKY